MIKKILKKFFGIHNEDMVQYWKTKMAVEAKVTTDKTGAYIMHMEGEKYPFPGFPRGVVLYKALSKLKHEIKNQVFNQSWYMLDSDYTEEQVISRIKEILFTEIKKLMDERRILMLPPEKMTPAVREIWRAFTIVANKFPQEDRGKVLLLRDVICFIMQEDDAYRFRFQWLIQFFGYFAKKNPIKTFDYALSMLEHAEIVGDMKERQRLLRRILMTALKDKGIRFGFEELCKEWDWKKLRLSKADKYFFRGKWFKVDYPKNQY